MQPFLISNRLYDMSRLLRCIFVVSSVIVSIRSFAYQRVQDSIVGKVNAYLETEAKQFRFNGVVLISKGGKIVLHKGYGWKDHKSNKLNDTSSIFQIGSLTKQFTSAIIFKLQEERKLSISDALTKFLPGFPNGDKITLHQLLTHTSGLYDYTNELTPLKFILNKTRSKNAILSIFRNRPLEFAPGSKFRYTNSGYFLLGLVIESVTGKNYEQVVRELIFKPTGMVSSGFDLRNLKSPALTTGYGLFFKDFQSVASVMDSTVLRATNGIIASILRK
ncbi:MAG: class A beta-lactamase-related serine hydrolase [Flavobacterium sp.]|nr:MAG: class A beta-lactamase-related serine hydrolase [Flavobacterium sp.]